MTLPLIAIKIKQRRAELGLTQEEVSRRAAELGHKLPHATLRTLEQGKTATPRKPTRLALAAGLDLDPSVLDAWSKGVEPEVPPEDDLLAQLDALRARVEQRSNPDRMTQMIRDADERTIATFEAVVNVFSDAIKQERLRRAHEA